MMKQRIIGKLATGVLALAAMFAVNATAGEKFNPGMTTIETTPKLSADSGSHIAVSRSVNKKHDSSVVSIQKAKNSKEWLGTDGKKVGWGIGKPANWVMSKASKGWVILLESNQAMAVTKTDKGLILQRSKGTANQVWQVKANRPFVK